MKVVALVSGGKDSIYSLLKCVQHGHEIVCLATLQPPSVNAEVDSFMFQSIGTHVVASIAACMELPLVMHTLRGQSLATDMGYAPTEGDEVEDLYALLAEVQRQFPDVEAVNTGAIFSNYQRTRVENVCARLGLTSVAYLWRKEQDELMQEMIDADLHCIVVKVASMGLHPRKHLGRSIADLYPTFLDLHEKYQFHICGEGGEYETLTLDCPLFKKRIVVDAARIEIHADDMFAPVGLYCIDALHLEDKTDVLPPPPPSASSPHAGDAPTMLVPRALRPAVPHGRARSRVYRNQIMVSGLACADQTLSLPDQVHAIFATLQDELALHDAGLGNVLYVHIYVQDMAQFAALNAVYGAYFPGLLPPSRSCVQVDMAAAVQLDCLALRGAGADPRQLTATQRDVLYIQSLSEWAPMCIGPYSQATTVARSLVCCAGQIPLVPETMTLLSSTSPTANLHLSFRNGVRVLEAVDSNLRHVVSSLVYHSYTPSTGGALAEMSREVLQANAAHLDAYAHDLDSDESDDEHDKTTARLALATRCPIAVVAVPMLPKAAPVEVELLALTHKAYATFAPTTLHCESDGLRSDVSVLARKLAVGFLFVAPGPPATWARRCASSLRVRS
ncbi:hypothetical protein SPRG_14835 [Saprolegnia parasitica CBS 223.65]|uniref:Diphthine--ammonia ligase n=1 Tax=Saprolegnia parasitica (strain CBS 223.65) TaxID=695850 RepID=A0A067BZB8_SAPPC|nr:hypothetical protein SPRG_14835 [Saprolegnia parasitica CBS 223.65]KDO19927.1 hypothetical protein SPRG_14835 [Saprolegnia parasitica CBS 223.65]|eukprot:XP_012209366.1 hypothetical protein SPRG_14835 [Saprolegnia parasitica CBS 223.65]